jgi:hypothetical protein
VAGAVLVILRLLVTPVSAAQMDTRTTGVVMGNAILPHQAVAGAVLVIQRLLVTPVSAAQMDPHTTGVVMESVILPHKAMAGVRRALPSWGVVLRAEGYKKLVL